MVLFKPVIKGGWEDDLGSGLMKLTLEFMKTKYIWEKVKITCETDHC